VAIAERPARRFMSVERHVTYVGNATEFHVTYM